MAIRPNTIEKYGKKQVIVMAGSDRFGDAREVFIERRYAENEAYLVVCEASGQVGVMLFLELVELLGMMGPDGLSLPLSGWPIRRASRVIEQQTSEGGLEVVGWVAARAGSRVVVIDEQCDFVCLFANPNRSALLSSSLRRLHGKLVRLLDDPRVDPVPGAQIAAVSSSDCDHQGAYRYDIQLNQYFCRACGEKVTPL